MLRFRIRAAGPYGPPLLALVAKAALRAVVNATILLMSAQALIKRIAHTNKDSVVDRKLGRAIVTSKQTSLQLSDTDAYPVGRFASM